MTRNHRELLTVLGLWIVTVIGLLTIVVLDSPLMHP
jgi:hypothetical protein